MILQAKAILPDAEHLIDGGGLFVERGRIVRLLKGPRAVARCRTQHGARVVDLGEQLLAPGWVNAHAHLELSGLVGRLPGDGTFSDWIRAILGERRGLRGESLAQAVGQGARQLVAGGTTSVGDISSDAASARAPRAGLRSVVYREVLDAWNPDRTAAALARVARPLPPRVLRQEGLSPHAPYTTSDGLLAGLGRRLAARPMPLTMHWAETDEEVRWLRRGGGAMGELLGPSPRRSGLELLEGAGLLGRNLSLAHGNHPGRGELQRVARAGCVVVHCPGTHAFFGRAPFPLRRYERAGVAVALGTDSLASNDGLDMRRELMRLRHAFPALSPERAFEMATHHGARALGQGRTLGRLRAGHVADCVGYALAAGERREMLEALTAGGPAVRAVWVHGRRLHGIRGAALS